MVSVFIYFTRRKVTRYGLKVSEYSRRYDGTDRVSKSTSNVAEPLLRLTTTTKTTTKNDVSRIRPLIQRRVCGQRERPELLDLFN